MTQLMEFGDWTQVTELVKAAKDWLLSKGVMFVIEQKSAYKYDVWIPLTQAATFWPWVKDNLERAGVKLGPCGIELNITGDEIRTIRKGAVKTQHAGYRAILTFPVVVPK